jgi:tetratricopeptide (TPR) repeat protein
MRHAARYWGFVVDGRADDKGREWALDSLGYMYSNQGRHEEAEKMYLRALQGTEKAWGPEHTLTLETVNNLGSLYAKLGRLDKAEKML